MTRQDQAASLSSTSHGALSDRSLAGEPPLCVDLDGTLIRSDLSLESLLAALRASPSLLLRAPLMLADGRAALKSALAERADIDPAHLPYNKDVVAFLVKQRASGRRIVLASASHRRLVEAVAGYLGLFDMVEATDDQINLKGAHKASRLVARFGERGFDYIGDSVADTPVWQRARHVLVVGPHRMGAVLIGAEPPVRFATEGPRMRDILGALRLYQWVKNLLVFVVLVAAHAFSDAHLWAQAGLAFLAFGLCASSVYIVNDLLDLQLDRAHSRKRQRPFAAGRLSLKIGLSLAPVLLGAAAVVAAFLPPLFTLVLGTYYITTCAYSLWLKRVVLVDVFALASLYTLRLIAGAAAVGIEPSFWLLAFSMFLFLSLAMVKRYAEVVEVRGVDGAVAAGRGYSVVDLEVLASLGSCSAFAAVLVLALYINSEAVASLYRLPQAIWLLCPLLLYWLSRLWIGARRGKIDDDPIVFALRDRVSRLVIALSCLVFLLATFGV